MAIAKARTNNNRNAANAKTSAKTNGTSATTKSKVANASPQEEALALLKELRNLIFKEYVLNYNYAIPVFQLKSVMQPVKNSDLILLLRSKRKVVTKSLIGKNGIPNYLLNCLDNQMHSNMHQKSWQFS
jgi:hypothetical protein